MLQHLKLIRHLHPSSVGASQLRPAWQHQAAAFSAASSSTTAAHSWLPGPLKRFLKKHQRGSNNRPAAPLQPGTISPRRSVPAHISRPHYATTPTSSSSSNAKGPGLSKQPEIMTDPAHRSAWFGHTGWHPAAHVHMAHACPDNHSSNDPSCFTLFTLYQHLQGCHARSWAVGSRGPGAGGQHGCARHDHGRHRRSCARLSAVARCLPLAAAVSWVSKICVHERQ